MAEMSLGDFFSQKKKPKKMGSNLNNQSAANKPDSKKTKKEGEEDGWEEQDVVAATLKVEVAGKLTRDDDKKEDEGAGKAAWGQTKQKANTDLNERKFPSLAKSIQSSNIALDGGEKKINIETSKNLFSALDNEEDDDDDGPKRPKEIKPAMVTKKKGEFEKAAIQREVDKYKGKDAPEKKSKKKAAKDEDEEEDDDDDEEEEEAEQVQTKEKKKVAKKQPLQKAQQAEEEEEEKELAEDLKIVPDLEAAKAKYEGRRKLEPVPLKKSELEAEKENRPAAKANAGGGAGKKGKKKGGYVDEEELYSKKLMVLEDPDADF
eukprot:TRINITY_DN15132_c0_g1_i2.p2 TRINITY_DN15132_c0_g1~~TRINITY_DN15132_c0_g1_i2.p2  ORF type:complete len:319 (+),score=195.45 TRINITY_DN15132_c0_g1_i2:110-1066(+)